MTKMTFDMNGNEIPTKAYRVIYERHCDGYDEELGYFFDRETAEETKRKAIRENKLSDDGICCSNSRRVKVEEIKIH